MSIALIITLRILHIAAGAIWVGAVVIVTFFVFPAVGAAGPAGGQVMRQLVERKYPQFVMALMGITILSGLWLMWVVSADTGGAWFSSPMGRAISLGATLAIVASVFGSVVTRPAAMRVQRIAADIGAGTPSPAQAEEMRAIQRKLQWSTRLVAIMMLLAVAAMAGARYM